MKKQYVNPEMDVVKVETMSVLAESASISEEKKNTLEAQSRDYLLDWDDEDDF